MNWAENYQKKRYTIFIHMSCSVWNLPKNINERQCAKMRILTGKRRHKYTQNMEN